MSSFFRMCRVAISIISYSIRLAYLPPHAYELKAQQSHTFIVHGGIYVAEYTFYDTLGSGMCVGMFNLLVHITCLYTAYDYAFIAPITSTLWKHCYSIGLLCDSTIAAI